MVVIATRLATSVHHTLRMAETSGKARAFLEPAQDDATSCLVYLAAGTAPPVDANALHALRAVATLMVASERFTWADTLGPRLALELAERRPGPAILDLYANLNHQSSTARQHVLRLAWLARYHLVSMRAAERILFNVGALHGSAERGVALLRAMCVDDQEFWSCIDGAWPDFAHGKVYGHGLDTPWPEQRDAVLAEALDQLRNPASALAQYVRAPTDLWDLERKAAQMARSIAGEVAVQPRLLP